MSSRLLLLPLLAVFALSVSARAATVQSAVLSPAYVSPAEAFHAPAEFPNYFLPPEWRGKKDIPEAVLAESEMRLEAATASVVKRITVPLLDESTGQLVQVQYFTYLQNKLAQAHPTAKVELLTSGGVLRAAVGYLYERLLQQAERNPGFDSGKYLEEVARESAPVSGFEVRGVGSDWDALIRAEKSEHQAVLNTAYQAVNRVDKKFGVAGIKTTERKAIFTIPDFKIYEEQMALNISEGGSTLDYLSLDVKTGKFVEPEGQHGIARRLVSGRYSYVPAKDVKRNGFQVAQTTVRGVRALLEFPFIQLEDDTALKTDLERLREEVRTKGLNPRVAEQFDKSVRNARRNGANNRFHRGLEGSVESVTKEIAQLGGGTHRYLPEFLPHHPIPPGGRELKLPPSAAGFMIPTDEFIAKYTDSGALHHGTPWIENALAILRKGIFLSNDRQGMAVHGPGTYFSGRRAFANSYAGHQGLVLTQQVETGRKLNIMDWTRARGSPEIAAISAEARKNGRHVFEELALNHGVDGFVVSNDIVVLQNSAVMKFDPDPLSLIRSFAGRLENLTGEIDEHLRLVKGYRGLYSFGIALGKSDLPTPAELEKPLLERLVERALAAGDSAGLIKSLRDAASLGVDLPANERLLLLARSRLNVEGKEGIFHLLRYLRGHPEILSAQQYDTFLINRVEQELKWSSASSYGANLLEDDVRRIAREGTGKSLSVAAIALHSAFEKRDPEVAAALIKTAAERTNPDELRVKALGLATSAEKPDSAAEEVLGALLRDSKPGIARAAAVLRFLHGAEDPETLKGVADALAGSLPDRALETALWRRVGEIKAANPAQGAKLASELGARIRAGTAGHPEIWAWGLLGHPDPATIAAMKARWETAPSLRLAISTSMVRSGVQEDLYHRTLIAELAKDTKRENPGLLLALGEIRDLHSESLKPLSESLDQLRRYSGTWNRQSVDTYIRLVENIRAEEQSRLAQTHFGHPGRSVASGLDNVLGLNYARNYGDNTALELLGIIEKSQSPLVRSGTWHQLGTLWYSVKDGKKGFVLTEADWNRIFTELEKDCFTQDRQFREAAWTTLQSIGYHFPDRLHSRKTLLERVEASFGTLPPEGRRAALSALGYADRAMAARVAEGEIRKGAKAGELYPEALIARVRGAPLGWEELKAQTYGIFSTVPERETSLLAALAERSPPEGDRELIRRLAAGFSAASHKENGGWWHAIRVYADHVQVKDPLLLDFLNKLHLSSDGYSYERELRPRLDRLRGLPEPRISVATKVAETVIYAPAATCSSWFSRLTGALRNR